MAIHKIPEPGLVSRYRNLPDTQWHNVPDEIIDCENEIMRIAELKREIAKIREDVAWNKYPKILAFLRKHWTDDELRSARLID